MTADNDEVWRQLAEVLRTCDALAKVEDDAVRMFALRVRAMSKALRDSVLVPPDINSKTGRE